MTNTKNFNRTLAIILTLSIILFCFGVFGGIKANAVTNGVSMYYCDQQPLKYGLTSYKIYIKTEGNASDQQVYVHYSDELNSEEIYDMQASYLKTLADGSKIWVANITTRSISYVIKYVADGQIFWDNNGGKSFTDETIGSIAIIINCSSDSRTISVTLKNYGYNKQVTLRYTTNSWNTYVEVPMHYKSTNANGTEVWEVNIPLDISNNNSFEYSVCYKVNGMTYWASSFC